ncbi:hypothetical protein AWB99_10725 [Mycolicibacterium confluentis]|nr:hypothetical protein AWB99_10725 [Mycolicibacterium confluentis]
MSYRPELIFTVIIAQQGRPAGFAASSLGHQPEDVYVQGVRRPASVIYAPHLGRAYVIAERIKHTSPRLSLLDLHVGLAEAACASSQKLVPVEHAESSELQNRLRYYGTHAGLGSYLADLARLGVVDGVIVSPILDGGSARGTLCLTRALQRLADELGERWRIVVEDWRS